MNDPSPHHVKLEAVDWKRVLPVLRVFGLFRVAMQPTKLALAWLMVATLFCVGMGLAWLMDPAGYGIAEEEVRGTGLLALWLDRQFDALWSLIDAVIALDFGPESGGLLPALNDLLIENPRQMWQDAPLYMVLMGGIKFVVSTLLGLGVARLAVLQLSRGRTGGPTEAVGFIVRKGFWALAAPLIPAVVVAGMVLLLSALGFVLFNVPVLDVVGGLAFGPLLLVGVAVAVVVVALALAAHLLTAAVAAEGTDAYDAVSRCFAYVSARPWQVVGYALAALVYGAVTFLLVWAVVSLGAWVTGKAVSAWVFGDTWAGGPGAFEYGGTTTLSAWFVFLWRMALFAVPAAYAVSFYFCASVQVYLLIRQSADGSELRDTFDPQAEGLPADLASLREANSESGVSLGGKAEANPTSNDAS